MRDKQSSHNHKQSRRIERKGPNEQREHQRRKRKDEPNHFSPHATRYVSPEEPAEGSRDVFSEKSVL